MPLLLGLAVTRTVQKGVGERSLKLRERLENEGAWLRHRAFPRSPASLRIASVQLPPSRPADRESTLELDLLRPAPLTDVGFGAGLPGRSQAQRQGAPSVPPASREASEGDEPDQGDDDSEPEARRSLR